MAPGGQSRFARLRDRGRSIPGVYLEGRNGSLNRYQGSSFNFTNHPGAILRRSSGDGGTQIDATQFHNGGLVESLTGTLEFVTSLINEGTLQAATGATIQYSGFSEFRPGTVLTRAGTNRLAAPSPGQEVATFSGAVNASFDLAEGIVRGTFTNTGAIHWKGGTFQGNGRLTLAPGSQLTLSGGSSRSVYYGYVLENYGTVRLESAGLQSVFGATVDNHGLFEWACDFGLTRCQSSSFVFRNHADGTMRKSAGAVISTLPELVWEPRHPGAEAGNGGVGRQL